MSKKTAKFLRNIVPEGAKLVKDLPEVPPVFVAVRAIEKVVVGVGLQTHLDQEGKIFRDTFVL